MTREAMTQMLRREMVPALGCTGPTAYALAAACCRPHLTGEVTGMDVYVSPAFLKIGFGVATPGTPEPGIAIASAIGLLGGDMTRGLEVLESAVPEDVKRAHEMVEEGKVRVLCDWEQTGVYVRAEVQTHKERVAAVVAGSVGDVSLVWQMADIFNGLMALPNLCALLLLSTEALSMLRTWTAARTGGAVRPGRRRSQRR